LAQFAIHTSPLGAPKMGALQQLGDPFNDLRQLVFFQSIGPALFTDTEALMLRGCMKCGI
jgi:hypothetical protein